MPSSSNKGENSNNRNRNSNRSRNGRSSNSRNRKSNSDSQRTRQYKPQAKKRRPNTNTEAETSRKSTNNKRKAKNGKKKKEHPKLKMALKIGVVLFLLLCVIGAGIIAGLFFGLFGDEFEITKEELTIGASNSVVVDANGAVITNLSGDEKRKIITLEDMADYLPKAYVAIEDERFYQHSGVDIKRTAGAILNTLFGDSSYGGSTITQQLVKNITKDDESTGLAGIFRKVKEWAKAYQVERMISKDQILELYLNILYVGGEGNLHGVELGAEYYFNKSAKDLTLAECAFLAGINSSPNYYNPYKLSSDTDTEEARNERIKNKTLTVLAKMKELGYIENEDEYNEAVAQVEAGLHFEQAQMATASSYSYHTDALINEIITDIADKKKLADEILGLGMENEFIRSEGADFVADVVSKVIWYVIPLFKNNSFSSEKEYRWAYRADNNEAVHFREKNGMILPFVKIKKVTDNDQVAKVDIEKIIIGPQKRQQEVSDGIKYYLECKGYIDLIDKVELSRIPYRD